MQSRKIDMFLKGEPRNLVDEPWLLKTSPVISERLTVAQGIHELKNYFDLVENFNPKLEVLLSFVFFILIFVVFCLCLSKFSLEKQSLKYSSKNFISKIFFLIENFLSNKSLPLKIILFFLLLFQWFCVTILMSNIKTKSIIVDTSYLIKNLDDLLNTKKPVCVFQKSMEMNMALKSSKGSLLNKLLNEKSKFRVDQKAEKLLLNNNRCLLPHDTNFVKIMYSDILLLVSSTELDMYKILTSEMDIYRKGWLFDKIFEFSVIFYHIETMNSKQFEKTL